MLADIENTKLLLSQQSGQDVDFQSQQKLLETKQLQFLSEIQKLKEYSINNAQFFENQLIIYNKELIKYR